MTLPDACRERKRQFEAREQVRGAVAKLWAVDEEPAVRDEDRPAARVARWRWWLASHAHAEHRLTTWIGLRFLAVSAGCAFLSLFVQWRGLIGSGGILPAAAFLEQARTYAEAEGWGRVELVAQLPTLFWLGSGDAVLWGAAIAGVGLALLALFDIATGVALLGLWLLYLSFVNVGGVFFGYQWDGLLLEALLMATLVAPWRVRPSLRLAHEPPRAGLWGLRLLVFKLMFLSGFVKLGHTGWSDLSALDYHFFTQPLPTPLSYVAHHLPRSVHVAATAMTLAAELLLPFLVFAPRRLRASFGFGTISLMLLIGLLGNYGFFNLLTVALACFLFDDAAWRRFVPRRWQRHLPQPPAHMPSPRRQRWMWGVAAPLLVVSALQMAYRIFPSFTTGQALVENVAPFRSINDYGLFASMTTERPVIQIEGTRDGVHWEPYVFRYATGAVERAPRFAGMHMPRLDWQMWFAALGGCRRSSWFWAFERRLLEGAPAVRALLSHDPFAPQRPLRLRSQLYLYTFAARGSAWWNRTLVGPFCPEAALEQDD